MERYSTAEKQGQKKLYRYIPYSEEYQKDNLRKLLQEDLIRLSNPRLFNDPWDCRPFFHAKTSSKKARKQIVTGMRRVANKHGMSSSEFRDKSEIYIESEDECKRFLASLNESVSEDIQKLWRVYCLSANYNCPKMWGLYADDHKGICLEFDATVGRCAQALKVNYHDAYPDYNFVGRTDDDAIKVLIDKAGYWETEEEYRILSMDKKALRPDEFLIGHFDDYAPILPNELLSITVGCQMSASLITEISDEIKASGKNVLLKRAQRNSGHYSLDIEAVPIGT